MTVHCRNSPAGVTKTYKGTEPSPNGLGWSAKYDDIAKKRKGKNGKMWQVVESRTGVRQWKSVTTKKGSRPADSCHFIALVEAQTLKDIPRHTIQVTQGMYRKILDGPTKSFEDFGADGSTNAYVFGKMFPLTEYSFLGYHDDHMASTSFVDVSLLRDMSISCLTRPDTWTDAYGDKYGGATLNNRQSLTYLRRALPCVLWVGQIAEAEIGASLYGHRDESGDIDSFIVDINHFFDETE